MYRLDQLIVRPARFDDLEVLVRFSAAMAMETEGRTLDEGRLRQGIAAVFESPARGFYRVAEVPGLSGSRAESQAGSQVIGQLLITFEWSDWRNARPRSFCWRRGGTRFGGG